MTAASLNAVGHETKPPARYTEATLVRELEEREIGRPSTYASIIGTILNRGYVYKKGTALVPAWLAFASSGCSRSTSRGSSTTTSPPRMEDVLDEIAGGRKDRVTELGEFYFGSAGRRRPEEAGQRARRHRRPGAGHVPRSAGDPGSSCGSAATARTSRDPARTAHRPASAPTCPRTCRPTSSRWRRREELLANPAGEETALGDDPETGHRVVAKNGRYGPYVTEVLPEDAPKPSRSRAPARCSSRCRSTPSRSTTRCGC